MKYLCSFLPVVRVLVIVMLLSSVFTGCGDDPAALAPFEPEVSNVDDSFSLQATGVTGISSVVRYTWPNSGTRASINHSTTTEAGTASLVIKDSAGTTVYSKNLSPSLNEPTTIGVAGNWTIELTLTNYRGTINFEAQKL
ncbi:MAG: hypothetical protein ACI9HY_000732 [Planctomycetaceae bacterium]|jgi:hypothetical protein